MSEANEITRKSQSNLAFAFFSLPKATRQDITTFYAFCRHVDDAADDPEVPLSERRHWLQGWRRWLVQAEPDEPGFASELRTLIGKYRIDRQLFEEILLGVEMDLEPVRFQNFEAPAQDIVTGSPARLDSSVLRFSAIAMPSAKNMRGNWEVRFN